VTRKYSSHECVRTLSHECSLNMQLSAVGPDQLRSCKSLRELLSMPGGYANAKLKRSPLACKHYENETQTFAGDWMPDDARYVHRAPCMGANSGAVNSVWLKMISDKKLVPTYHEPTIAPSEETKNEKSSDKLNSSTISNAMFTNPGAFRHRRS